MTEAVITNVVASASGLVALARVGTETARRTHVISLNPDGELSSVTLRGAT